MSKDVIIAGALALGCIALIAVAFIAPKSKPAEAEIPKIETSTTVTDTGLPGAGSTSLDPYAAPGNHGIPDPTMAGSGTSPVSPGAGIPPSPGATGTTPFGLPPVNSLPPTTFGTTGTSNPNTFGSTGFGGTSGAPTITPEPAVAVAGATDSKTHIVKSGELLGDISQKYYGSAKKWQRIVDANPGLDAKNLKVGQKLTIPMDAKPADSTAPGAPVVVAAGERTYTVKSGDSLYQIAKRELGSASRWKEIDQLNNIGSNDLKKGQVLKLPAAATAAPAPTPVTPGADTAAPAAGGKTHTVAKGELLGDISKKYYGTSKNWKKIVEANPGVSPESLKVGQKLVIPDVAPDAGAAPATGGTSSATYTVKSGDTLGSIAQHELGSKQRWKDIQAANPGLDPRTMRVGQKIVIPGKSAPADTAPAAPVEAPKPANPFGAPANQNNPFGVPPTTSPSNGIKPTGAAPTPGFGGTTNTTAFGAPTGATTQLAQPTTAFPTDNTFASPYGAGSFGQPSQPFNPGSSADNLNSANALPTSRFDQPAQPIR